jgi:hypothetical protein
MQKGGHKWHAKSNCVASSTQTGSLETLTFTVIHKLVPENCPIWKDFCETFQVEMENYEMMEHFLVFCNEAKLREISWRWAFIVQRPGAKSTAHVPLQELLWMEVLFWMCCLTALIFTGVPMIRECCAAKLFSLESCRWKEDQVTSSLSWSLCDLFLWEWVGLQTWPCQITNRTHTGHF